MSLEVRIATSAADYRGAAELIVPAYHRKGYYPDASELRVKNEASGLQKNSVTVLLAMKDGAPEATITLRNDGPAGLSIDTHFGREVNKLRSRGYALMEFGLLATWRERPLCRYIIAFQVVALKVASSYGADVLVAAVHPDHERYFYRDVLGFRVMAGGRVKYLPEVNNAPAIGIFHSVVGLMNHRFARQ
ncbi:MAG: hypothetical protein A3G05_00070 [Candidatus Zambryskibacteria bacterium RIFCSPLOWO2_12_FULL_45_14]|uniref:N-acyl amino acid synthase FeeM catalytic core domain-containing protein n=1 Tax=Candidatus Zambryskibacteria bacterium RIFCSPLOWO2_12_FULL_45_14 TaxID=1802778 RepID=A0A1G2UXX3_9BACT|nr:MAG: hypothetical protein A3G05_00070 [Candidatus Zambryskibacteria bacterium RIFCSPLOWO2_12_FULL_45_14]